MIIIFGKKGCHKTAIEKKILDKIGKEYICYDICDKTGKTEALRRGLSIKDIKRNTPWVINE